MRRWNGWGDEAVPYPLHEGARRFLHQKVGEARPPRDATLDEVMARVPESRLPSHPLVNTEPGERVRHARGQSLPDWIVMRSGRIEHFPDGVAHPRDSQEVGVLLEYAARNGIRLIPYGGGTSVVGHINVYEGEIPILVVDLGRMNRLLRLDEESYLATFEAGVRGPDLEAALRAEGYTLGHYPQSFEYSTLGGWICTRSSGQQSLGYGRIERLFAGGRLETFRGTFVLPPFPASAAGPDLRELVLGSEGRFGILTEATIRVRAVPESEDFRAIFFPDFESGRNALKQLVRRRLPLTMLRLSTAEETGTTLALAGHEKLLALLDRYLRVRGAGGEKCLLIYGLAGSRQEVAFAAKRVRGIAGRSGGIYAGRIFGKEWHKSRFKTPYLRNTLWEEGYAVDTLETAVPWSRAGGLVKEIQEKLSAGLSAINEKVHVFTHLSHAYIDGCSIYTTYVYRIADDPEETLRRWRILKELASRAIVGWGGTISHQHGVGRDHLPYLQVEKGELGMSLLRGLGEALDPGKLMNPGKLF
ncbi:MAG: FAD-binding oxidoreductase [Firmicutes bacterium]|nr:FAD-binding oxidoreductase [Bacillota bacterium]